MERSEVLAILKGLIVDNLDVNEDDIEEESKFEDNLGADSLDIVELLMAIDERFEMDTPDEVAEQITTVGAAVDHIMEYGSDASLPATGTE